MKKMLFGVCFILTLLNVAELKAGDFFTKVSDRSQWKDYGVVAVLGFPKYRALDCISDNTFCNYSVSDRFYELEAEEGLLLTPCVQSKKVQYRYVDGDRQFRMKGDFFSGDIDDAEKYIYFSLNPYSEVVYVVDSNNRPVKKTRKVDNYTYFAEYKGNMYFIRVN